MFKIVIPSYNRLELIQNKTLKTINKYFNNNNIEIHVFTPNDYSSINNIYPAVKIHRCRTGLINARTKIMKHFKKGEYLLFMDDDINDITLKEEKIDLYNEICNDFNIMKKNKIYLGGICPCKNVYLTDKNTDFNFCVGSFYYLINDKYYLDIQDEYEDYERSILYYIKYSNVYRNNNILVNTKYDLNNGGMFSLDRYKNKTRRSIELLYKYPNYVILNKKKNYLGIKLRKNKKTEILDLKYNKIYGLLGDYINDCNIKLDKKKNYFFRINDELEGYIIRNLYIIDDEFKFKVCKNQNRADISGKIKPDKIERYYKKKLDYIKENDPGHEIKYNKTGTRVRKDKYFNYEFCNTIHCKSGYLNDFEIMNDIYNDVKYYNIFKNYDKMNYFTCNYELRSALHIDKGNKSDYSIILTKNNFLNLLLPELDLEINNRDGDFLVFNGKNLIHGNSKDVKKKRYSIIFFEK